MFLVAKLLVYPYRLKKVFFGDIDKLQVGSGKNKFSGWINADISPGADIIYFLGKRLPFSDGSLRYIYSEHVLEHVERQIAAKFLSECHRVLRKGGVVRIAMPDLDHLISCYQGDWKQQDWVNWPEFSFVKTRCQMINMGFREWGHKYLYNREELAQLLLEVGFSEFEFQENGASRFADLEGLETREDSRLVVEAYR